MRRSIQLQLKLIDRKRKHVTGIIGQSTDLKPLRGENEFESCKQNGVLVPTALG